MAQFKRLDAQTAVAGQLSLADVRRAADAGIKLIINNRPDGEGFRQPKAKDLAAEAARLGIAFVNLPFSTPASMTQGQVREFARLLGETEKGVLAFCRSGTRSTAMWIAAKVAQGEPVGELLAKAADAGYDMRSGAPFFQQFAEREHAK